MKIRDMLNVQNNEKKCKLFIAIYCIINAIIFLTICSKNSFLYVFNNWDDPNSFFTMGKGMANGAIIYKDLFEQKGPILYVMHAIAYIIQNRTFIGIFLFEIIFFAIFLYYISKIISLYTRKVHILWGVPLISFIILSSYVFIAGDSAEEFCLPFLAIALYEFLKYYKNTYPNKMDSKKVFINGIMAGCVLWIKYNLLGFWLGFAGFMCIGLLFHKKFKDAILTGVYFLLGMLIPTIPVLIYFAVNGAINDLFQSYFFVNISFYSAQTSIIKRLATALHDANMYVKNLPVFSSITLIGYVYMMLSKRNIPNIYGKIALTITILISAIGVYYGANHIYYFLILMPFAVMGLIAIARCIDTYVKPKFINWIQFGIPIYLIIFILLTCKTSSNFEFRKVKKEDLVQYQFAEIINQNPGSTLLNYGFLDGGFYTVTGITPNVKYFHKPNFEYEKYPIIMDEQNRYIKEKLIDFVVIRVVNEGDCLQIPYLNENYRKLQTTYVSGVNCFYMLYEKI